MLKLILAALLGIAALASIGGCSSYNGLVSHSQGVDKAWAEVEADYQRRFDLIPNLVRTVEGSANFERSALREITEARASVGKLQITPGQAPATSDEIKRFEEAHTGLGSALSRLLVVAERYPDLKSTSGFRDLQTQLEGTENRIAVSRKRFNEAVQSYNTRVQQMPSGLIARLFNFQVKPYFRAETGAEKAPKVEFSTPAK